MKAPIVLLTDFGLSDAYAGILRGVILSVYPGAMMVDLTHHIRPYDIHQAAYELESAYVYFPKGTVFLCVVDPGVGTARKPIALRTAKHYFVGPDNGIFSGILENEKGFVARELTNPRYFLKGPVSSTFHGRDIFAPAAAHLAKGKAPHVFDRLGPALRKVCRLKDPAVRKTKNALTGRVVYFDRFGNAITNIRRRDASEKFWRNATVWIRDQKIGNLRHSYGTGPHAAAGLINSTHRLEIAIPRSSAKVGLGLKPGCKVAVRVS